MYIRLKDIEFPKSRASLTDLPSGLLLINTINAHSYNVARKDADFAEALLNSDVLLPDGASIVKAVKWLRNEKIERIAGWDLFVWEMMRLNTVETRRASSETKNVETRRASSNTQNVVLFLGSTEEVLTKIKDRAAVEYPNVEVHTYSPPYKPAFSDEDNATMIDVINTIQPDVLFVGMTAPKQEKWAYKLVKTRHATSLQSSNDCHVCSIGAVFDFYAGTVKRAPLWWQRNSLEWLYRLLKEPKRMWRRYLLGNTTFLGYILEEKFRK